jgi:transcriptional regulator with GAF, ATPase, and Fis domain
MFDAIKETKFSNETTPSIEIRDFTANRVESLKSLAQLLLRELELLEDLAPQSAEMPNGFQFYDEVQHFEEQLIRNALVLNNGNQRKTADMLGLKTTTLNVKIKRYQIEPQLVFASRGKG